MKYNWSIIGHQNQLMQIERDIESGNMAHAYLLAGPNSVGKHTVAKKFAGILQCENDFCHTCSACIQVQRGSHIDTIEMVDNGDSIKIGEVRKIIERLNMTRQSKYNIFLVQSVERMTIEAANSFLKILEEPPQGTIFILTTDNIRALLPTLVSRVRVITFNNVSADYLKTEITKLYPHESPETIEKISLFSMGKTGQSIHLMENPDSLAQHKIVYNDVQNFLNHKNITDRFSYVEAILEDPRATTLFLNMLTNVLRSKVLSGAPETKKYIDILLNVAEAGVLIKKNVNSRLVLENLMLSL